MVDVAVDVSGNVQAICTSVECVRTLGTVVVICLTHDGIDVSLNVNLIVRAVGGEIPGLYPVKALIKP